MAISPAYSVRSPDNKSAAGARTKSLSILNNSKTAISPLKHAESKAEVDAGLDLSEQLNDESRQKYVKGKGAPISNMLHFMCCILIVLQEKS